MPILREATVAVVGTVMDIESLSNFETKAPDGLRVVIATGDGFAQVKVPLEESKFISPSFGESVAWLVRYGAYANKVRQSDAQTTCRFVRELTENDLDKIVSASRVPATSGK